MAAKISARPEKSRLMPTMRPMTQAAVPGQPESTMAARMKSMTALMTSQAQLRVWRRTLNAASSADRKNCRGS